MIKKILSGVATTATVGVIFLFVFILLIAFFFFFVFLKAIHDYKKYGRKGKR